VDAAAATELTETVPDAVSVSRGRGGATYEVSDIEWPVRQWRKNTTFPPPHRERRTFVARALMPGLDGDAVCRVIKPDPLLRHAHQPPRSRQSSWAFGD
jgi:hypothetical protein